MRETASVGDEVEQTKYLACALPEFVAARFIVSMNRLGVLPEEHDLQRRFPALQQIVAASASEREMGLDPLTRLIEDLEGFNPSVLSGELRWLGPGTLAYNEKLGVTVLTNCEPPSKFWVVDLSREGNRTLKYSGHMKPIPSDYPSRVSCWSRNIPHLRKV